MTTESDPSIASTTPSVRFSKSRTLARYLLVLFYVGAGINHFVMPAFYLRMIPPVLPWPEALNALAGVAELVLGLLVIPKRTRQPAGWGIVALLVAIFPANIYMALNPAAFPEFSELGLWLRLPFQLLFIVWAIFATRE